MEGAWVPESPLGGELCRKDTQSTSACDLSVEHTLLVCSHRDFGIFVIAANVNYPD